MRTLASGVHVARGAWLLCALGLGCGEDAEQTYAGLSVESAATPEGLGFRVRFLSPPWSESDDDPLVLGTDTTVELRGKKDQPFIEGTAIVLEIERQSIVQDTGPTLAKYRFEAMLLDCDVPLAAGDSCAERIAIAENEARTAEGEPSLYANGVETRRNDFAQTYFELLPRSAEMRRYKRVAFYETPDPTRYLRVYLEANPRLDETEVTRMLNAIETFEQAKLASAPALDADGGTP